MAIGESSSERFPRSKIAFVGGLPNAGDLDWFTKRFFLCKACTPKQLSHAKYALRLDAVIWTQDPKKQRTLLRELGPIAANLLNADVRVYIRLASARSLVVNTLINSAIPVSTLRSEEWRMIPESGRERENSFLMPSVYIFESAVSWADIAAVVCDRPAGSSPRFRLKVEQRFLRKRFEPEGHLERVTLLKRAFWNCSELQLTSLQGGMSGTPAFQARASLGPGLGSVQQGPTGAHPHQFFVKIGPRKTIIDEYDRYISHISEYIPFHLRPRLRLDRCNLGSTQGILVGDFVEGAEPLVTCARGARCGHAISNLFEKTLGGWRKQQTLDTNRTLGQYLETKWYTEESNALITLPLVRAKIVKNLEGDTDVASLKQIFDAHGNTFALVAPAHGDMHATNVLVRHGDAILIDFEKLQQLYPLTYDPASLEGGLLVEGFLEDLETKKFKLNELVEFIGPLYEQLAFKGRRTIPCRPGDPREWYYDAVNQIRTLSWATENEPGQYALTLALCLIRKGCNTHKSLEGKASTTARAIAFFFGQKLLRQGAPSVESSGETTTPLKGKR